MSTVKNMIVCDEVDFERGEINKPPDGGLMILVRANYSNQLPK
jgi:hypothetical protein